MNIMQSVATDQPKVEFFFVGIGKCGTSWIFEVARKRALFSIPSIKETYFIDQPSSKHEKLLTSLYQSHTRMADFSNVYYWDAENPQKIFDHNPNAKIIITTRTPSRRMISHFNFLKRNGTISNCSLAEYLEAGDSWSIYERSIYRPVIQRYEEMFKKENVLILPLELLKASPQKYLDLLTEFCGIENTELSEQDKLPVLKQSKARSSVVSKLAKTTALSLRRMGMLQLLGKLKDSPLIRSALYKETAKEAAPDNNFGEFTQRVAELDKDYLALLESYDLSTSATPQQTS